MLINIQIHALAGLSDRVSVIEDKTRLERNYSGVISPEANASPHASSFVAGFGATDTRHALPHKDTVPDNRNGTMGSAEHVSEILTSIPSNPLRRNSNNPFFSLIEKTVCPHDASIAPLVPPSATEISLLSNHVRGSLSNVSKVDNSTRKNFNNVTHNVTTNFNGNIFVPAFPVFGFHPPSGLGGVYSSGYPGYDAQSGYRAHVWNGGSGRPPNAHLRNGEYATGSYYPYYHYRAEC
ncbi:hypothetical protein BDP27DRAFT_559730 [Rhodocollybia butyracea]|uniref:Uncharacterized protein n=1 Tax=Rhodocollybia butyracea TaxID=206335 RepID=A0A9P5PX78_9AGAR|nr:hypothetical protein BDP27DRAFT_559730 [Rhodocollybia butyracea]